MRKKTKKPAPRRKAKPIRRKTVEELTHQNVKTIFALEEAAERERTGVDRFASVVARFCGCMRFVWLHLIWFSVWIAVNTLPNMPHFDPFPFTFLTLCVSLEAIFLSTFILISQNNETRLIERRHHLDLQVNLLAEQENTKMLMMLKRIAEKIGAKVDDDSTVEALEQVTKPDKLAEQIEETIEKDKNNN